MYNLNQEKITFNDTQKVCGKIENYERLLTLKSLELLKKFPLNPSQDDYLVYSDKVIQEFKQTTQPNDRVMAVIQSFIEMYIEANKHYPGILIESSHNLDHVLSTAMMNYVITKNANLNSNSTEFLDGLTKEQLIEFGMVIGISHDWTKAKTPGIEDGHGLASAEDFEKKAPGFGYSGKDVIVIKNAISSHETITAIPKLQPKKFLDYTSRISDKMDSIGYLNTYRWTIFKKEHKWDWGEILKFWKLNFPKIRKDFDVCPQLIDFVDKRIKQTDAGLKKIVGIKEPSLGILYCQLFI